MINNQCGLCATFATQKCGGCQLVYYCSREHQKAHWKKHRTNCKPMRLCQDDILGRYYTASRPIKSGEVVLKEVPLIQGPSQMTGPVCLSCLQSIGAHSSQECPKCGWPMCRDPMCLESSNHEPECDWTLTKRGKKVKISNFSAPHPTYESITVLRCLYQKFKSPHKWDTLMQLEAHTEKRKTSPRYENDRRTVGQFLRTFFNLKDDFSEEEILHVCGILQVNAHEMPLTEPSYVAVFDRASFIEHSCFPNLYKSFSVSGEVVLRAMKPISTGDHLSICYTDPLWGTVNRRHHLLESKYFLCECERCKDPTEFGTCYSGVRCTHTTCRGFALPHISSNVSDETWICNTCNEPSSTQEIQKTLIRIGEELSNMKKQNLNACVQFLRLYDTGRTLNPNHYYLTDVRIALAQLYGQTSRGGIQDISDENLTHKIALCKQLAAITKTIIPAEGRIRGIIIFELHASVAELGRRMSNERKIESPQLRTFLLESKQYLEEAVWLLQYEPPLLPEGKILQQAQENLKSLNSVLQSIHSSIGDSPL